jgi:hypothetical protein
MLPQGVFAQPRPDTSVVFAPSVTFTHYAKPLKFLERARFSRSDFVPIEIKHDHSTHQENIGFRTMAQIGHVFFLLFPPLSHLEPQCLDLEQSVSGWLTRYINAAPPPSCSARTKPAAWRRTSPSCQSRCAALALVNVGSLAVA